MEGTVKPLGKRKTSKELDAIASGQVCPLPVRGGTGAAKGALGTAILTIVI